MSTEINYKDDQIKAIKKRLHDQLPEDHNPNKILTAINALPVEGHFNITYQTLANTLNFAKNTLDIFCIMAICRCYNLDISYILAPTNDDHQPAPAAENLVTGPKFNILDDPLYCDKHHGYMYGRSGEANIHHFELEIKKVHGTCTAYLTIENTVHIAETNTYEPKTKKYRGTPILCSANQNIYINFSNDKGEYYYFYFTYHTYDTQGIYYRLGAAVTHALHSDREPIALNFLLFKRPVPEAKLPLLHGLLRYSTTPLIVSENTLQRLIHADTSGKFETFYKEFKYLLKNPTSPLYTINEEQITAAISESSLNVNDIMTCLMLLKKNAIGTDKHRYAYNELAANYGKKYLQQE